LDSPAAAALPDQPAEKEQIQKPEPSAAQEPDSQAQPQYAMAASEAGKDSSSAAAAGTSIVEESTKASTPILTAVELQKPGIELRNGNGVQDCARTLRSRLSSEGFNGVSIGDHIDFGLEETIIAYRPEAAEVAKVLSQQFFSGANLQEEGNLPFWVDIRVFMGQDLIADQRHLAQLTP
jgi:hypothetical protein